MSELALQLDDVIRVAQSMREAAVSGVTPDLSDARILRGMAQCAEHLVEIEHVQRLRATTPEQDRAAQREMASSHHAAADRRTKGAA